MRITVRSIMAFGTLLLLFSSISLYQLILTKSQNTQLWKVNEINLQSALLAQDLEQTLSSYQIQNMLPATGYLTKEEIEPNIKQLVDSFNDTLNNYQNLNPSSSAKVQQIKEYFDTFISPKPNSDPEVGEKLFTVVEGLKNTNIDQMKNSLNSVIQTGENQENKVLVTLLLFVALGITISYVFARSLVTPIKRLISASSIISEGNLSHSLTVKNRDEIGELTNHFERMRINLAAFVKSSKSTANEVFISSEKLTISAQKTSQSIARINDSLTSISNGAHIQMQSTEESAIAMEEMSRGIGQICDSAEIVANFSVTMEQEAKEGGELLVHSDDQLQSLNRTVDHISDTVKSLETHSKDINQIINTINEISSQTNLLSLNASIEAARAGDHGKGFAVVADEIRKLSIQTKSSSEEVNGIIGKIQSDINSTVNMVAVSTTEVEQSGNAIRAAREAFGNILTAASNISNQAQEVSAATEQMTAGIEEVSASVSELAKIASHSFAESESVVLAAQDQLASILENEKSTEKLQQLSSHLQNDISSFTVE